MAYRCFWRSITNLKLAIVIVALTMQIASAALWSNFDNEKAEKCSGGAGLKYLSGDALIDSPDCLGPNNSPYPSAAVARTFSNWNGNSRRGRQSKFPSTLDPAITTSALLRAYDEVNNDLPANHRFGRSLTNAPVSQCRETPSRLCKTRYNTTAPMYGVSLTSGQPVTIVQKFPDLLQQVVFEVCESGECDVVRGECTQTYVPYLFLVIPLGPVTLTGQDYVLVESGCVCKPKYSTGAAQEPNMIP
uniref:Aspartate carbamoyltransferase regulatory chain n=1 Tax=Zeugodacus cucurbitae TaxID=28588 RepID=A0A0A1XM70_ZEUCU